MKPWFKIGDSVVILIGPAKGQVGSVVKVEMNAGARNGWFTVQLPQGKGLYAGEELATKPKPPHGQSAKGGDE